MASPPAIDVAAVSAFCEQRVPQHARHQVRVEADVDDQVITIVECHVPWRAEAGADWTTFPIARLRWTARTRKWTLFSRDRNLRWRRYPFTQPTSEIAILLGEIDRDSTAIFWG